jgi:hypothetical protein
MPRKMLARAAVVVALGWAVAGAPRAFADYYPKTPPQATELPPGLPPVNSAPSNRPLRDHFHHGRPLGCWSSFNGYGCSSLHSELGFLFGSCRMFFGEPCLKGAPPSALPPWAGPMSGYGPNSAWAFQAGYGVGPNGYGYSAGDDGNGNGGGNGDGGGHGKSRGFFRGLFKRQCSSCAN